MTDRSALPKNAKYWALLAIGLLAAFLRLWCIAELPPGDGYDPAWYGIDALAILNGDMPVYMPTNIGREAMFSYIVACSVAIVGVGPHAIHLASAVVGVLTVPATYLAAEKLFETDDGPLRDYGGLISALVLAVSFWHQQWSRYGVRAILVPLFSALSLWALACTLGTGDGVRRRWFAGFTGLLLGLSLYTYQSARVLPFLGVAVYLTKVSLSRAWTKRVWVDLGLLVLGCTLVFAPMASYLLHHPGVGGERITQTWALDPRLSVGDNAQRVWAEVVDAGRVVAIEGDNEPIHNLRGRPAMNAFLVGLAVLGLVIALARIKRWPYWTLFIWIPVMSITAFVTLGGQPTKRALGALPGIAMLVAAGALMPLAWLGHSMERRYSAIAAVARGAWILALVGGFVYSAIATYRDYFLVWGKDAALWTHFEGGRVAIGRYAGALPSDEVIYSSPEMPNHPSIVYNSGGRTDLKGYNGRLCTVVPITTTHPTTYIITQHEDRRSLGKLEALYPTGMALPAGPDYFGQPYFTAYRVPAGAEAQIPIQNVVAANWEGAILSLGYDADSEALLPGDTLNLTLYTRSLAPVQHDYVLYLHLLGPENTATGNTLWAQDDSAPCRGFYPTSVWHPPEVIIDTYSLAIPEDAPAGTYELKTGFYTWPDFQHLTTMSGPTRTAFVLGEVDVGGR